MYDSNIFLQENKEVSDFSIVASPWVNYRSAPEGGARFILDARYGPFVRAYLDNSSLNSLDHSGSASLSYAVAKLNLGVNGGYSRISQSDRFAGTVVDASVIKFGLDGSYQLSQKTSLDASWNASMTDYESGRFSSSDSYGAQVTGFWQATPLIRLGPSLRHSVLESDNTGDREAWAFLMRLQYELTGKVDLSASGGLELEEYSRSGGDTALQFTGGLTANYAFDALWSFGAGVNYRTLASPSTQNYSINDLGLTLSVNRAVGASSLRAGVAANFSDYQSVGPVVVMREDEQNFGTFISHRMGLFDDRVGLNSTVRYSKNSGQRDWSRFQVSTGFNYTF
jgi:hypothetical protein